VSEVGRNAQRALRRGSTRMIDFRVLAHQVM
jgi:hypothetical protein